MALRMKGLFLSAMVALAGPACAQTAAPADDPLTTLLRPQPLTRSRPLVPEDRDDGGTPCERAGTGPSGPAAQFGLGATRTRLPGIQSSSQSGDRGNDRGSNQGTSQSSGAPLEYSGSGPGEYGRYFSAGAASPAGATSAPTYSMGAPPTISDPAAADPLAPPQPANARAATKKPPAPRRSGIDRPLLAGNDEPLWNTGERRAPGRDGRTPSEADGRAGPASQRPLGDRPLWEQPTDAQAAAPCASDIGPKSP